jgi:hypothetical protein
MTTTTCPIPVAPFSPPLFRVLYAPTFGGTSGDCTKSTTTWTTLSQPSGEVSTGGVELEDVDRRCFPEIGTATFRYVYGTLPKQTAAWPVLDYNEVRLQLSGDGGTTWVTVFWGQVIQTDRLGAPGSSFSQGVIRYHVVDGFARTLKWPLTHSGYDSGSQFTPNTRTESTGITGNYGPFRGHPGYNYQPQSDGPLLGNKSPAMSYMVDGISVACHIYQGALSIIGTNPNLQTLNRWFEIDMINHACVCVKPVGEPCFILPAASTPSHHGYYITTPQPVYPNEAVFDFIMRVTNRQRGNGIVRVDWTDNVDGSLSVYLRYSPLNEADTPYTIPGTGGTTTTIEGATTVGCVYTFDTFKNIVLSGDHRNVDEEFSLSDASMHLFDMVETFGENIEVGVTLCGQDGLTSPDNMVSSTSTGFYSDEPLSLQPRWSPSDVTTFIALTWDKRTQPYWDFLYQALGLPRDWGGYVGDGMGNLRATGTQFNCRADYRCDPLGTGEIIAPNHTVTSDTPPYQVELLGYLPFYEGYDYTGSYPKKTDNTQQYGLPQRRQPMVILNPSGWSANINVGSPTDTWFLPGGQLPQVVTDQKVYPKTLGDYFSPSVTVQPDGIICKNSNSQNGGIRVFSDPVLDATVTAANSQLEANLPVCRLAFTVGIRLPHRLYFMTQNGGGTPWTIATARKRKEIYIENANLWLAAPNCIFDLSQTSDSTEGYAPVRGALGTDPTAADVSSNGSPPAVLRDDRQFVYRYHVLASKWYLSPRSRLSYAMKFCAFLPFTWVKSGTNTTGQHPKLGDFIEGTVADGTSVLPVGTVVTRLYYDHQRQISKTETDYFDLEHT